MFCAIRPLDFRSHLKLHIYIFENDQEHVKTSLFGWGMKLFFHALLKGQWKRRLFSQIFITVLTFWKARISFTTQQTSCISWVVKITIIIIPVIRWGIPDFVPSFHFALRYFCFVAITMYAPYPQRAYHSPKRCVAKNLLSSRISQLTTNHVPYTNVNIVA